MENYQDNTVTMVTPYISVTCFATAPGCRSHCLVSCLATNELHSTGDHTVSEATVLSLSSASDQKWYSLKGIL